MTTRPQPLRKPTALPTLRSQNADAAWTPAGGKAR